MTPPTDHPLSEADHLLVCLIEECSEVIKEASKALRFGMDGYNPYDRPHESNAVRLQKEFYEAIAVFEMLEKRYKFGDQEQLLIGMATKRKRLKDMMEISRECGRLL